MANEHIEFAGDYNLSSIVLHNHQNQGVLSTTKGIDIKALVVEFNIYESMFSNALVGSLVVNDTLNLIANLPIQGTERVSFKLSTPGAHQASHIVDCTDESGHPMHIYKLTNRVQANDNTQQYTLHFCSRELYRSLRTKVSQSYSGRMDQMVLSIFGDENYLDSRKQLNYQRTRNQDKIVIPNLEPFQAIKMLCKRALADDSKSAGFFFFETTKGFHFRSFESFCVDSRGNPRPVKGVFRYNQVNMSDSNLSNKMKFDYESVESYNFVENFHDVLANTALGTYGHRVITHNIFNKSYREDDYHYHSHFSDTKHTDGPNPAIVNTPVDFDDKTISDYPESKVTLIPTTQYAHGEDTGNYGIDVEQDGKLYGQLEAQENQVLSGTKLVMTVKGQSLMQVGDVIQFDLISVENKVNSAGSLDPQYSGRYVITKIRHRVVDASYKQVFECVKDSVARDFQSDRIRTFPGKQPKNKKGYSQDINQYDDIATTGAKKGYSFGL